MSRAGAVRPAACPRIEQAVGGRGIEGVHAQAEVGEHPGGERPAPALGHRLDQHRGTGRFRQRQPAAPPCSVEACAEGKRVRQRVVTGQLLDGEQSAGLDQGQRAATEPLGEVHRLLVVRHGGAVPLGQAAAEQVSRVAQRQRTHLDPLPGLHAGVECGPRSGCGDHGHRLLTESPDSHEERAERSGVSPLHVVDEQQDGLVTAGALEEVQQGTGDPGGADRSVAGWLAEQACVLLSQPVHVLGQAVGEVLDHREGTHVTALRGRRPCDAPAPAPGRHGELVEQGGLAHPCLPDDELRVGAIDRRPVQQVHQGGHLMGAAQQPAPPARHLSTVPRELVP